MSFKDKVKKLNRQKRQLKLAHAEFKGQVRDAFQYWTKSVDLGQEIALELASLLKVDRFPTVKSWLAACPIKWIARFGDATRIKAEQRRAEFLYQVARVTSLLGKNGTMSDEDLQKALGAIPKEELQQVLDFIKTRMTQK